MPLFYFKLKANGASFADTAGEELSDEAAACGHARGVALELMRNREPETAHWRIQVCDEALRVRHEYLFAEIDTRMEQLPPQLRSSVEAVARTTASLGEAFVQVKMSMSELRATLAQLDKMLSRTLEARPSRREK